MNAAYEIIRFLISGNNCEEMSGSSDDLEKIAMVLQHCIKH